MAAAGLATALGALPAAAAQRLSHRKHDALLGFAAGVMLGVALVDLLPHSAGHIAAGPAVLLASILAGALAIFALVRAVRRLPLPMPFVNAGKPAGTSAAFLIFLALTIHNAPEGLATGMGYAEGLTPLGHAIALGVALQNIPEGFLVAVAVLSERGSMRAAVGYATLSGLVEPVAGAIGLISLSAVPSGLGVASGFAVGAMLCVVLLQMVPESFRHGHHVPASIALLGGFVVVLLVQALIGLALG